jgi:hypothetical protein
MSSMAAVMIFLAAAVSLLGLATLFFLMTHRPTGPRA